MLPLFSATLFLSAALLFLVQPMFARFVLPAFGSTPAVWTTSMLFFQSALLAGYAYAHASTARLGVRRQAVVHLGLLALAAVALPLATPAFAPRAESSPVLALLGVLLAGVGLPFFAVAATGPLLQRWLAATDHPAARDPYFLYRASNLGSVVGLLAYPLLMEPRLRLADQGVAWAAGYALLALCVTACAVALWRSRPADAEGDAESELGPGSSQPTLERRARWVGLAACPATLAGRAARAGPGPAPGPTTSPTWSRPCGRSEWLENRRLARPGSVACRSGRARAAWVDRTQREAA